ncbi:hypothetical protein [Streptomyces genisteinicus]|uniref:Uncharacterized protein n=1 Tax=Streptomyces genisteinicus TaxID=2768068 RepID=A0A7H0I599_9ACTN|nr:hypothetical protein [Streptomyces genisteinicus]QNP67965.1 hypothetical protein IAG43_33920 [Streptomyces genisteinicus]
MNARDLYQRYQAAARAAAGHDRTCRTCASAEHETAGTTSRCPQGERLTDSLARLQDAYLTHLKNRP